ncbi:DDHD domain containing protein [Rhodotorula toruloides]|uniref:DDHD domain containing protein n=1 Tax=Rhodotorula toruloides TaxID=5286 RepID=A0A511KHB5_RHOTO|nr:DDHD domain containing protein [Rhodotorula toruloides]
MDYFGLGAGRTDELHSLGSALLTPSEALGYLSPIETPSPRQHSPATAALAQRIQEAADLPLATDEEQGKLARGQGDTSKQTLSPSQLNAVLNQDPVPPPPPQARFLHGGPPLSDLEAPSAVLPQSERRNKPIANSDWRAFTDEEEKRLHVGWERLQKDQDAKERWAQSKEKGVVKEQEGMKRAAEDEADPEDSPYLVPVGLDNLFTVSLFDNVLYPAFWSGSAVRVLLCHWFYAPPSSSLSAPNQPSHLIKPYPVDPTLSASLDRAYSHIRPWDVSYAAELASALNNGAEAQKRLATPLGVENEAETEGNVGIEVIFEGKDRGRVYSKGMLGSMSKSLFSNGKSLGGGQVVLRGWDALKAYIQEKAQKKAPAPKAAAADTTAAVTSDSDTEGSSARRRPRADSASTTGSGKRSESPGPGLFASLRQRIVGGPGPAAEAVATALPATEVDGKLPNETQEAVQLREEEIGTADELVLVIHGIGQSLAASYDSFNFLYAVNAFRSQCTSLSTAPALSPLLRGKRAQFIPVLWRAELDFDNIDNTNDSADEHLANHFGVADIEIQNSVPFLRQVVSGLVLDVPFYLSPAHKEKMLRSVVKEANRIYHLWVKRNPEFEQKGGKVSIIAHSLGSVMAADILSSQPTFVKQPELSVRTPGPRATLAMTPGLKPLETAGKDGLTFAFDTRVLFLVGSPLAFFLHLGKGQLIARAGRERTKHVARDIALDRSGRYGCLAVDAVYNVYQETDPVAFLLAPTVDVRYAKLIKPVAIPSSNQTLLQNLSDAYHRVSKIFDMSSLWGSSGATTAEDGKPKSGEEAKGQTVQQEKEKEASVKPARRPSGPKRMPTERVKSGAGSAEYEWVSRAEKRMKALNASGTVDFYLPSEGISQYIDALTSHQNYWHDRRVSTFVLTQLFSDDAHIELTGREEVGVADEE